MQQEHLEIFAQPLPLESDARQLDMNNPGDYSFAFEIGLKPAIDIDPKKIKVIRYKVEVNEKMIDEEIDRIKTRHGKMTDPEEVTTEDNVLNTIFVETDEEANVIEEGINRGSSLLLKYFTDNFRQQLLGKKKDDSILFQLNKAFDEKEREWLINDLGLSKEDETAGEKYFKMTITKVGLVEKPAMDEVFYEAAFPGKEIQNEDDFRKAVLEYLQAQWDIQSSNQLHDQLYHELIDHQHLDFPEHFLKHWIQKGQEEAKTAEQAESEYPSFVNSLKWTLISSQLINQNQINVSPDDIKESAKKQIMGYMNIQSLEEAPWLESYTESMLKDKKFIENTYYQLQTTGLFKVLEKQVEVEEEMVTPEKLNAMQHHHSH
jgi:trigger factor